MPSRSAKIEYRASHNESLRNGAFVPSLPAAEWTERPANIREAELLLAAAERLINAQQERIKQLENLALTDELTGLVNRRGLMAALKRELAAAERDPDAEGMVIMVDLNGFKQINDTYGHNAGDAYLQAVAAVLLAEVRPSDVVARLGGDEFAILLKRISQDDGQKRLQRLDAALHQRALNWDGKALALRASFGAAHFSAGDAPEALLAAADVGLYEQKSRRSRAKRG